ncbi:oxidoreductase [Mycobacterium vulneris]|jgi:NAD(P)-dependent dehydrogenase (short-subunit alcohol dehydrogenase family)|uniref:Oxidoreductase n=1 Tax=Mycolicibacterium vulneris TaxID=547163 RepID=A0A1X2KZ61_9MYCO|nr:SDR family oxidoreductase [Mycolicibacterium vulneris]OSC26975.1 oxidoreductase [Mycolicibacterium vulneris]
MNQRVALVTGAAGGQGLAIANRLRGKGFSVAACDRRIDELRAAVGGAGDDGLIALELDVTSPEQWDSVVAEVVGRFGSLSALVNCAGVLHRASLTEETTDGFETAWRVNCLGPFLGMRAALEQLRKASNASVVNICSTGAIRPFPQHSAYGSSKWALRGLTQTVAAELAPSGIRVNAVFPGPIATSMLDEVAQARLAEASMFGRIGEAGEVADAVAFLVSDEASFITGSELIIDGGQCLQIR